MTLSATILEAQEFARRLTLKADGVVLAYDEVLGGFSWTSATPATPVTTGTAAQRAAVSGSAGQLFHETDTSVLLQWTAVAAAWKAVAAPGAWTSASRPPVGTTDAAYEGLEIYEQNTGKVMVLRRTTLGSAISGGNPLIWSFVAPLITAGPGVAVTGDGSPGTPFVLTSSLPNPVRNASAKVWQDGASIACGTGAYTADGWYGRRAGAATGQTVSRQAAADTSGGAPYCFRQLRDNGNSSTAQMIHEQSIPTEDSAEYAGQTVTLSARVRALAGYSGGAASLALITGTGTDESLRTGFTGQATAGTGTVTPSTSWQTVYVTATLASSVTQLGVQKTWTPTGTAGANDGLEWKDVRIDRATAPLDHAPLKYEDDLREAQRYYELANTAQDAAWISTPTTSGNPYYRSVDFKVVKRAAPTMTLTFSDRDSFPTSAPTLLNAGTKAFTCYQTASATANSSYYAFTWKADARI